MQIDRRALLSGIVFPPFVAMLSACGGGGGGGGGGTSSVSSSAGSSVTSSSSSSTSSSSSLPVIGYSAGSEITVNAPTSRDERQASISSLSNGGFVVVWTDFQTSSDDSSAAVLQGKIYDANGSLAASVDFSGLQTGVSQQVQPAVSGLTGGGFAIVWRQDSGGLVIQVFNSSGTKVGSRSFVAVSSGRLQSYPCVTALSSGSFVVCWMEDNIGASMYLSQRHDIKAQVFTAVGALSGAEFVVSSEMISAGGLQVAASGLKGGGFVVAWDGGPGTLGFAGPVVRAQLYDNSAQKVGAQFLAGSETHGGQKRPAVASLSTGGFVIGWEDTSGLIGNDSDGAIVGQVFGSAGSKTGVAFLVNTTTALQQANASIAGLANGQFLVSWNASIGDVYGTDQAGILGQVFSPSGEKFGGEFQVNTNQAGYQVVPVIAALGANGFIIAWNDQSVSSSPNTVKARLFAPRY